MDLTRKPVVDPSFTAEDFDSETLIYNEAGSKAFYLNDAANAVLQLCREDLSVGQIIECLQQAYPDKAQTIADDVAGVLETLIESGVVTLSDE